MTTFSIDFRNSNEEPIYLQVDPWAGSYKLNKGEEITIIAETSVGNPSFHVEEYSNTRILHLSNSSEYYVVRDGERVHWSKCPAF